MDLKNLLAYKLAEWRVSTIDIQKYNDENKLTVKVFVI